MPRAIIFDLYGTLLQFDQRAFLRDLVLALGRPVGGLRAQGLRPLLVRRYPTEIAMLSAWCLAAGVPAPGETHREACRLVLQRHLQGVRPYPSVRTLLAFLRRRGFKLGLLSNVAEAFTLPFRDLHLDEFFDAIAFSCDTGRTKPDPSAYLSLCLQLGTAPEQCLFVGDSPTNDYEAPRSLGLQAVCLRQPSLGEHGQMTQVAEMLWTLPQDQGAPLAPLVSSAAAFQLGSTSYCLTDVQALPDEQQGRYNLVGRVTCTSTSGEMREFHCKRFLAPDSAEVEHLAHQAMELLLPTGNHAALLPGPEPILLVPSVPGRLWTAADMDESAAEQIGAHCAAAYLLGNADLRPRNTFVHRADGRVTVSVIDLEHCFFDRALDLRDLSDQLSPELIDGLGASLETRTKHRVLSPAATRRTRRSFLPVEDRSDQRVRRFLVGWLRTFETAKHRSAEIEELLLGRVRRHPSLIIGTQSYRRPMAVMDIRELLQRIHEDPSAAFDRLY